VDPEKFSWGYFERLWYAAGAIMGVRSASIMG